MEYKQVIVVRDELKLPKGKLAGQVAHASVEAVLRSEKSHIQAWRTNGQKKVVLKVQTLAQLYALEQQAKQAGLVTAIISDAGRTCIEAGTVTCVGIGPDQEQTIDAITKNLQLV
jgi:peptidyl-tRNA hydrolase, PTH2 family